MRRPGLLLLVLALAAGCGGMESGDAELRAVATTTHVADLVGAVGGERVELHGILSPDADPHGYQPRPSDAAALAEADVVFESGGDVDGWLDELVDSAGGDARVVSLLDAVRRRGDDPHWWQDPRNAILAVEAVRAGLVGADPAGRAGYEHRAAAYVRELRELDADIERCIGRVPPAKRKLVTTHDSLGYFAARYGIEVIGAVIPSLSTQAQPSARDVDRLVSQIEDESVEAVFPEAAVSQRLERAIARESGAEVGEELWTDSLGPEGSGAETYVTAMRSNAAALAEGMSGGRVSCFSRKHSARPSARGPS
ncbi:MAG: metal ABC transporter solute-binding protein, Zn/Mn family [Thermoleophilaceae bacterium]